MSVTSRHRHDGLYKRCGHPRRQWAKCEDAWHAGFQHKGQEYRTSLHVYARSRALPRATSKTDAEALRDRWRNEVRDGTWPDGTPAECTPRLELTFADVCQEYVKSYANEPTRRERAAREIGYQVDALLTSTVPATGGARVALSAKPFTAITRADVEHIRDARRERLARAPEAATRVVAARAALKAWRRTPATRKAPRPPEPSPEDVRLAALLRTVRGGEVATNRLLRRLRHIFSWAIAHGYTEDTPFKRQGVSLIKLNAAVERGRVRRLDGDEERRLLAAAGPHLRALIEAALETGCRKGELLTLQWSQVHLDRGVLALPGAKTKTGEDRLVPITSRLEAILTMRRHGPDGQELPAEAYVFGNEMGERVKDVKTAWTATCRRAGITDLHFHDLRRECGSRLLEAPGVALHEVRDWLGHTDISTTSKYLATTVAKLQDTKRKFELARIRRTPVAQNGAALGEPTGGETANPAELSVN